MKERKKLIFPGLRREPIKLLNRACTAHEGTGRPLEGSWKPRQENEPGGFLCSRELARGRERERETDRHTDMGTQASGGGRV